MDILQDFPVRKSNKQKKAFREAVASYAETLGYPVTEEKGSFGARNLLLGDPEKARYLVTAHYDTCAWMPLPNLLTPCTLLPFLGYQLVLTLYLLGLPMVIAAGIGLLVDGTAFVLGNWIGLWYLLFWGNLLMLYFGPANRRNANDNTSGVVTLLEIAKTLPENQRDKVCFVFFDLEEAGLIGSAAYRKAHKTATDRQLVFNLDCVGDGDHIRLFPTKKLRRDKKRLSSLYKACGYFGKKDILLREKGFAYYPSDQKHFPYGVGICALRKSKFGLYLGRIHTHRDTVLETTNVNLLRAALGSFLTQDREPENTP